MSTNPWFVASCKPNPADPWESVLSGFLGGVASVTFVFPIHKVMFGQQVKGLSTRNSLQNYLKAGPRYYFKGSLPPLLQKGTQNGAMFGFNKVVHQQLSTLNVNDQEKRILHSLSGVGSGSLDWILLTPFERIQSLLMDQDRNKDPSVRSTFVTARNLMTKCGFRELYRGGQMTLARNVISSPMYLFTLDWIKSQGKPQHMPADFHNFLVSSITGGSFSTLFYPLNILKAKAQMVVGGNFPVYRPILKSLLKEGGWRRLWRGAHLNFLRSSVSWGITYAVFESFSKHIHFYRCPDEEQ